MRTSIRATVSILAAVLAVLALSLPASAERGRPTYTNAVTDGYSIDFPDPTIMRGRDGAWYAYSTGGPYDDSGTTSDPVKMARSTDLTHWTKLGAVFTTGKNWPTWAAPTTGFWAPDIRYVDGRYLLYFVAPDTTISSDTFDPAIGVATAPTPAGPWTDSGAPVMPAQKNANGVGWTTVIDPAEFTDTDGQRYLYFGSYGTGIRVVKLTADGLHTTGAVHQVATTRFEGSYVIHRGDWYYLFASSANCCAGPSTGYAVFTGRSRSPLGPFLDRDGVSMSASRTGGTIVVAPNGNRWIGVGHNAIVTDQSGQTYLAYHAVDRTHPYLGTSPGFTMRPMLLDRLDWIDGWPTVRGGQWASDSPQPAPVTAAPIDEHFTTGSPDLHAETGTLRFPTTDPASDAGGYAQLSGQDASARFGRTVSGDVRVEADVRSAANGSVGVSTHGGHVRAEIAGNRLRVTASLFGLSWSRDQTLPADFDPTRWHVLSVRQRGRTITAQVSDGGLGDPYAVAEVTSPLPLPSGSAGIVGSGRADVDNVSVAPTYRPHTAVAPVPSAGALEPGYSDDFDSGLGAGWSWLRPDPDATVTGGTLRWPTETADLSGDTADQAGVLLRDPPAGDYIAETKVTLDLGVNVNRDFQQAGLVVYGSDTDFLRLDTVATGSTRIVEFGKRTTADGVTSWGGSVIGPPAATVWLRLAHHVDPRTGEHLYRAASSRDGRHWIWGTTWTQPAGSTDRIGLVSQGSTPATTAAHGKAVATFDYFHVYQKR